MFKDCKFENCTIHIMSDGTVDIEDNIRKSSWLNAFDGLEESEQNCDRMARESDVVNKEVKTNSAAFLNVLNRIKKTAKATPSELSPTTSDSQAEWFKSDDCLNYNNVTGDRVAVDDFFVKHDETLMHFSTDAQLEIDCEMFALPYPNIGIRRIKMPDGKTNYNYIYKSEDGDIVESGSAQLINMEV